MSFLHPWFLLGALAAGVPFLLHLLRRRRVERVEFSSLRFLRKIHRVRSWRMKVAQILLLLCRMALICVLAVAFAQPFFTSPRWAFLNAGRRTTVLLWDDSCSMGVLEGEGSARRSILDRARQELDRYLARLGERDQLTVLSMSPRVRRRYQGPATEFSSASLPAPTAGRARIEEALVEAREIFDRRPGADRSLVIMSDFTDEDWPERLRERFPTARLRLLPIRPKRFLNRGIRSLGLSSTRITAGEGLRWPVEVVTSRLGRDGVARLTAQQGDRPVQSWDLPAAGAVQRRFEADFLLDRPGVHELSFRLDGDDLAIDDELRTRVEVLEARKILWINGEHHAAEESDELYFVRKVFGGRAGGSYRWDEIDGSRPDWEERFMGRDLAELALVGLADVGGMSESTAGRLSDYVHKGGRLLVFLGPHVRAEGWNGTFFDRFPLLKLRRPLRSVGRWLVNENAGLPLDVFVTGRYWSDVTSSRWFAVDTGDGYEESMSACFLPDGTPAMLGASFGRGSLHLFNASADLAWGDLALHPIFPVFLQQMARTRADGDFKRYRVGERIDFAFDLDDPEGEVLVRTPGNELIKIRPGVEEGRLRGVFDGTDRPGWYEVTRKSRGKNRSDRFEVSLDPREMNLTQVDLEELGRRFPQAVLAASGSDIRPPLLSLDRILLLALLLLLLLEALLVLLLERRMEA